MNKSLNAKYDAWILRSEANGNKTSVQKTLYDRFGIADVQKYEYKKTDEEILNNINIEVIEKYLRKKKLEKIKNSK